MRSFCVKEVGSPVEPATLAYKCERGHLFAFHYDKPRENSRTHRSGHISRRANPPRKRICAPTASIPDVKM